MGRKDNKCVVCGGVVRIDELKEQYKCTECNATYETNLFKPNKNAPKPKRGKIRIRWFVVILGTFYILWLIYRFFLY